MHSLATRFPNVLIPHSEHSKSIATKRQDYFRRGKAICRKHDNWIIENEFQTNRKYIVFLFG